MNDIQLKLNDEGQEAFVIEENGEQVAEMVIGLSGNNVVIYHTEVSEKLEGKGMAKELLMQAVAYAREQHKKIIPLCPFVSVQFKKHPDEYADVWEKKY
ncbi:MAG: GNAT family N-acetyltransferase [Bacteroidota bacterium]